MDTATRPGIGDRITGRCVTNYTEHTGVVVDEVPVRGLVSAAVVETRLVIVTDTGRRVIVHGS